jgi:3-oxoacyl-[acyl-carrier-protein] synthase II
MASSSAVAVTGLGVITPLGDSLVTLAESFAQSRSSIAVLSEPSPASASRLMDFEATHYANIRGMRVYNRASRLAICATRLAMTDAGLESVPAEDVGVVFASRYAHLDTLIEYDRNLMTVGPSRTNPALMPLAIASAPGAVTALSFGLKAFSITLSNGDVGGLDALGLAMHLLEQGRARATVVVSASSLCSEIILSASRAGLLADAKDVRVFDCDSRGTAVGEAAVALVLEPVTTALGRGSQVKAILHGHASTFAPRRELVSAALTRASSRALALAGSKPAELSLVSSAGSGVPGADRDEALALIDILAEANPPVIAVKASLGETGECSGLLQTIAAITSLTARTAWPIPGLRNPAVPGLPYAMQTTPLRGNQALLTATTRTGSCSALVLSLPND